MIERVYRKLKKMVQTEHSMLHHPAEKYYFHQYWKAIEPLISENQKILEIGCHEGRFTIPLLQKGLTVHATDIKAKYEQGIREISESEKLFYSTESVIETAKRKDLNTFDSILCLELLYTQPTYRELLTEFYAGMKEGSYFISSHRSKGYYIYRFLKEKKWEELEKIMKNEHPVFNAQHPDELREIYNKTGFKEIKIVPVGSLSGFGNDSLSGISDPSEMETNDLEKLMKLETSSEIQGHFSASARYLLVIAQKND